MKKLNSENKVITYTISKVADSKDMYISVQNGEVEIIAPYNYSNKHIQKIIEEKRDWILKKLKNITLKMQKNLMVLKEIL